MLTTTYNCHINIVLYNLFSQPYGGSYHATSHHKLFPRAHTCAYMNTHTDNPHITIFKKLDAGWLAPGLKSWRSHYVLIVISWLTVLFRHTHTFTYNKIYTTYTFQHWITVVVVRLSPRKVNGCESSQNKDGKYFRIYFHSIAT